MQRPARAHEANRLAEAVPLPQSDIKEVILAMPRKAIHSEGAPKAIGAYSQAIISHGSVYLSGQIPLDPETGKLVTDDFPTQLDRIFRNLSAIADAAGGSLDEVVKLTVYLTDLADYPSVNEVMERHFSAPYPARAVVGVAQLPLGVPVEVEAILDLRSREDYSY